MKPILKTTHVPLTCQEAFDLFIAQIDEWWPKDSHAPLGPKVKLSVTPGKNGEIVETAPDGTRNLWGRIIGWEPGAYLAFTWFPDSDETDATVVAISFVATADGTRLDLTHGDFEILGENADAISTTYLLGWDLVLGSYCFAASKLRVNA